MATPAWLPWARGYRDSGLPVVRAACVVLAWPGRYCPAGGSAGWGEAPMSAGPGAAACAAGLYPLVMDGGDGCRGAFCRTMAGCHHLAGDGGVMAWPSCQLSLALTSGAGPGAGSWAW